MKNSVSTWLSMSANLRNRLKDLEQMKESNSIRKSYRSADKEVLEEPTYNIKVIDKKCVEIHNALFQIDSSIKTSNSKTEIDLQGIEYSILMEAIQ